MIDLKKILLVVANLCNFKAHFCVHDHCSCKFCTFIHSGIEVHVLPALLYTHMIIFVGKFKCICHVLVLSYIEADHAIANMNELIMFPYNLWMSYLRQHT